MGVRVVALLVLVLAAAALWLALSSPDADPGGEARDAPSDARREGQRRERPPLERVRCPDHLTNCAEATGRVIAVEAVDPDGDGDAHYVLAGGSITGPGISVIDVSEELRPRRLPGLGDQVSAAGPVYTGSYGQRQIEAIEVRHRRR
jgi:hypothetical protein